MAKKTNLLGNLNLKALDTINKQEESVNTDLIFSHFNFEFEMEENELDFLKNQTISSLFSIFVFFKIKSDKYLNLPIFLFSLFQIKHTSQ